MKKTVREKIADYKFSDALAAIWHAIAFGDKYVNEKKVWEIKEDKKRAGALFNLVVLLDNIAAVLAPFLPETSRKITGSIVWKNEELTATKPAALFPRA